MADDLIKRERKKANIDFRGGQAIGEQRWNEPAGADKVLPVNGRFKKNAAGTGYMGALSAPVQVQNGFGSTVAVYNNSGTTAFVMTGKTSADLSATPDATNGIAIPPNSYMYIAMGEDQWIKGSAATCLGYELDDQTYIAG